MLSNYKRFNNFDKVTKFRLINAFIAAIGINLIVPIITDLKGEYLVAWVISLFMILETLAIKTNRYMVDNFTLDEIYKISTISHLLFTVVALLYFVNPLYMVIGDTIASIIVITVFSAYSIKLNNYITNYYPDSMSEFQIVRNSTFADGILIGLSIVTLITFLLTIKYAIIVFVIFNFLFSIWLLYNWNFFKDIKD